jgi:hypothetical protein
MTPPCFICGFGTTCQYGGPARRMSPEEFEDFTEVTLDMFQKLVFPRVYLQAMHLGFKTGLGWNEIIQDIVLRG